MISRHYVFQSGLRLLRSRRSGASNLSSIATSAASAPSRQGGFTLIEVLVSVLIFSFGVLGAVGLQAAALQANKDTRHQSSAVRLGRDLADMMRNTKSVAVLSTTANPYLVDYTGTLPTSSGDCYTTACTSPTLISQFNIREWLARVEAEFPEPRVVVCFDETPYDSNGFPQWTCSNTGGLTVLKLGWTRKALSPTGGDASSGMDKAAKPSVVFPLIAGSTE